jgi:Sulfotransferase domain
MIVSHKHKIIFIKPRKVAGTSFEISMSKFMGEADIVTPISQKDEDLRKNRGYKGAQNFEASLLDVMRSPLLGLKDVIRFRRPRKFFNHMSAERLKCLLPERVWNNYKKISIVRNPWDCLLSSYHYSVSLGASENFSDWVQKHPYLVNVNHSQYFIQGELIVDHFLRFEHLAKDVKQLEKSISGIEGLSDLILNVKAKSDVRPKESRNNFGKFFSENEYADNLVRNKCNFEISKFGYTIE